MGGADQYESAGSPEHFLLSQSGPRNKQELLSLLPERIVTDRLMMRYFSSNSPSQRKSYLCFSCRLRAYH